MKNNLLLFLLITFNFSLFGQNKTIKGKVIAEDFWELGGIHIYDTDYKLLDKTNGEGEFELELKVDADSLIFGFPMMESVTVVLSNNCDHIEMIMFNEICGTSRTIKKRRRTIITEYKQLYFMAFEKGLFQNDSPCFKYRLTHNIE